MEPDKGSKDGKISSGGRPRSPRIQSAILKAAVDLVLESGFKALSMDAIAGRAGVGRMTIYRRWPNKAAIIMDAFVGRVDPNTLFLPAKNFEESIRLQMRKMAKAFRGKDGALIRALLAEHQIVHARRAQIARDVDRGDRDVADALVLHVAPEQFRQLALDLFTQPSSARIVFGH